MDESLFNLGLILLGAAAVVAIFIMLPEIFVTAFVMFMLVFSIAWFVLVFGFAWLIGFPVTIKLHNGQSFRVRWFKIIE